MNENKIKILLVEDEPNQRELVGEILHSEGYSVTAVASFDEATAALEAYNYDVVFSDWKLAQGNGLDLLHYVKQENLPLGFVIATAYGTIENAVIAMQSGADDYLTKPFQRPQLLMAISKAYRAKSLKQENVELSKKLSQQEKLEGIVGESPCMQRVFTRIEKLSSTNATVLITGESGTGKELAARALHRLSNRKHKNFIAINCGAIPETLAEAELFGSEKGAFTGANQRKIGKLEAANEGTVFLDEIGELSLPLQTNLLRFLQEGTISRIGSNQDFKLDVRVIAATHRNLKEQIETKAFREDLFYRLNVVPIEMPPLRERREDLPALIEHFLTVFSERHGQDCKMLSKDTTRLLLDYSWPGNVRELSNIIERFVVLNDEEELRSQLQPSILNVQDFTIPEQGINWQAFEKSILLQALKKFSGNRTKASQWLGLPYKAFLYRIEKYRIID